MDKITAFAQNGAVHVQVTPARTRSMLLTPLLMVLLSSGILLLLALQWFSTDREPLPSFLFAVAVLGVCWLLSWRQLLWVYCGSEEWVLDADACLYRRRHSLRTAHYQRRFARHEIDTVAIQKIQSRRRPNLHGLTLIRSNGRRFRGLGLYCVADTQAIDALLQQERCAKPA